MNFQKTKNHFSSLEKSEYKLYVKKKDDEINEFYEIVNSKNNINISEEGEILQEMDLYKIDARINKHYFNSFRDEKLLTITSIKEEEEEKNNLYFGIFIKDNHLKFYVFIKNFHPEKINTYSLNEKEGYLYMTFDGIDGIIENFYTEQRRKIGSWILNFLLIFFRNLGIQELSLGTNTGAEKAYKQLGFQCEPRVSGPFFDCKRFIPNEKFLKNINSERNTRSYANVVKGIKT